MSTRSVGFGAIVSLIVGLSGITFTYGTPAEAQADLRGRLQAERLLRGAEVVIFDQLCTSLRVDGTTTSPERDTILTACDFGRPPVFALHCNDAQTACSCTSGKSCTAATKICGEFRCTNKDDAGTCIGGAGLKCSGD